MTALTTNEGGIEMHQKLPRTNPCTKDVVCTSLRQAEVCFQGFPLANNQPRSQPPGITSTRQPLFSTSGFQKRTSDSAHPRRLVVAVERTHPEPLTCCQKQPRSSMAPHSQHGEQHRPVRHRGKWVRPYHQGRILQARLSPGTPVGQGAAKRTRQSELGGKVHHLYHRANPGWGRGDLRVEEMEAVWQAA